MLTLVTGPSVSASGATTAASATVTLASTAAIAGAVTVSGTGIPPGTLVKSVDSATEITLTKNATATGSPTLTFGIEPVTLAEAKLHLKIDSDLTDDDNLIAALITAARKKCETETWRTFLTSTWDYSIDEFPWGQLGDWHHRQDQIRIPNPPLISVTSLAFVDDVGSSQVMSGTLYQAIAGTPGVILPSLNSSWPYGRSRPGTVIIRYVAGYGATADSVPDTIKAAIKLLLSYLYVNRGDAEADLPCAVAALLACEQTGAVV